MTILSGLKKNRAILIQCPECDESMRAADAEIFDGTKKLGGPAAAKLEELHNELAETRKAHELKVERAKARTYVAARSVNIGKTCEKIAASLPGFPACPSECRGLFEPIDLIHFRGLRHGTIDSLGFIDIKTGKSRLNGRQLSIRAVLQSGRVSLLLLPAKKEA